MIDDFLLEVASRGLSLRGQFLAHLVREAVSRNPSPTEQEVADLVPGELLRLAKAWKKDPEAVIEGLKYWPGGLTGQSPGRWRRSLGRTSTIHLASLA